MQLNHINLRADRATLESVKNFYCDVLGFEVGERPGISLHGYWLYSEGAALVHLQQCDEQLQAGTDTHFDHVAFQASDLPAMVERLERHGVDYRTNRIDSFDLTQLFILDPIGIKVELNFPGELLEA